MTVAFLVFKYFFSPDPQHLVLFLVLHTVTASLSTSSLFSLGHKNSFRLRNKAQLDGTQYHLAHPFIPHTDPIHVAPSCPLESRHFSILLSPFRLPQGQSSGQTDP